MLTGADQPGAFLEAEGTLSASPASALTADDVDAWAMPAQERAYADGQVSSLTAVGRQRRLALKDRPQYAVSRAVKSRRPVEMAQGDRRAFLAARSSSALNGSANPGTAASGLSG